MSDPRELLRRYLEQRRDLGETDLALDQLDVAEAMRLITGSAGPAGAVAAVDRAAPADRAAPRGAEPPPRSLPDLPETADWRAALSASGLAPGKGIAAAPSDTPRASVPPVPPVANEPAPVPAPAPAPEDVAPVKVDRRMAFTEPTPSADAEASGTLLSGDGQAAFGADGLVVGQRGSEIFTPELAAAASIDAIAQLVARCAGCELTKTKTRDVVGEGNPNADFVVVGEAPGEEEDKTGRPFVGASGQLLTKILAAIQLPREQVYICNVLKHRPPGNRNPSPAEVAACSPFLLRQLELVKPKVILALGTFAAQTLLRTKEPIGKLRGRVHRYYGIPLVVTYHPAALLRNPNWKRPTWDDVQLARRILDRATSA